MIPLSSNKRRMKTTGAITFQRNIITGMISQSSPLLIDLANSHQLRTWIPKLITKNSIPVHILAKFIEMLASSSLQYNMEILVKKEAIPSFAFATINNKMRY